MESRAKFFLCALNKSFIEFHKGCVKNSPLARGLWLRFIASFQKKQGRSAYCASDIGKGSDGGMVLCQPRALPCSLKAPACGAAACHVNQPPAAGGPRSQPGAQFLDLVFLPDWLHRPGFLHVCFLMHVLALCHPKNSFLFLLFFLSFLFSSSSSPYSSCSSCSACGSLPYVHPSSSFPHSS